MGVPNFPEEEDFGKSQKLVKIYEQSEVAGW
jgi:hypothetical protein